jgi:hypothetical protein
MSFQAAITIRWSPVSQVSEPIRPFYGVALVDAPRNSSLILSLTGRGPTPGSRNASIISLTANGNYSYYYAYPVSYGEAQFMEVDSNGNIIGLGYGGWDGAGGDPISIYGPIIIPGVVADGQPAQDFYVYQSDWPGLGLSYWQVS